MSPKQYYLSGMNTQRNFTVYLMTTLIAFISVNTSISIPLRFHNNTAAENDIVCSRLNSNYFVYIIQEKKPSENPGTWKNQFKLYGFNLYLDIYQIWISELKLISNFFVIDMGSYNPYKFYLLYPFHDFA